MGYSSVAQKILWEYNFLPDDSPHEETPQQHSTSKFEYNDIGGGQEMVNLANPGASMSILVIFEE